MKGALATPGNGKTLKEQIMNLDFWYKVKVLSQVAPPAPVRKSASRGPFVAVEGDNSDAIKILCNWLADTLSKDDDLKVKLLEGPKVFSEGSKQQIMAQAHRLAADWLLKSNDITESLLIKSVSPTDSVMVDALVPPKTKCGLVDEKGDGSDEPSKAIGILARADEIGEGKSETVNSDPENMDVDTKTKPPRPGKVALSPSSTTKPVSLVANYSLYASNFFACHIPIETHARYSPKDHWEWTATHWRGIISPDLTIYLRDSVAGDAGKATVEIMEGGNVFVVKRTKVEGKDVLEVEPSTLRRLGFEVSEWVREFGENVVE